MFKHRTIPYANNYLVPKEANKYGNQIRIYIYPDKGWIKKIFEKIHAGNFIVHQRGIILYELIWSYQTSRNLGWHLILAKD